MSRRSPSDRKMCEAKAPLTTARGSSGATSPRDNDRAAIAASSCVAPLANAAPTTAPIDVPTRWPGVNPASAIAFHAPAQARDFAPPPPNTATTLTPPPPPHARGAGGDPEFKSQVERRHQAHPL